MQQLIYFIQRYKYFLYFLLLEIVALALIINNHNFHRSKFVSSTRAITGKLHNTSAKLSDYLRLKSLNNSLAKENEILKNKIEEFNFSTDSIVKSTVTDSVKFKQQYVYINGKIIDNQYHLPYNFLLINRGKNHGVHQEMAVTNSKGIIGVTDNVSNNYARVQSILNRNSRLNARFKNNSYFGTLLWDGKDYNTVQLTDIPRQAPCRVGDTIITGGKSVIFPEGIPVGTVKSIPENQSASNTIDIKLFNDMSNLRYVYIINNLHKQEIEELQNSANE